MKIIKIKNYFEKIPNWFINLISIISGIFTILTTIIGLINLNNSNSFINLSFIVFVFFIILLLLKLKKYRKLSFERMQITSENYHKLTHDVRDIYFEIMKYYKVEGLNIGTLSKICQSSLIDILDYMCNIMQNYTGEKITASIKFIAKNSNNYLDTNLITFCRSKNSDTTRGSYEKGNNKIILNDNTDFLFIVDPNRDRDNDKNYFYQNDLELFSKELEKQGKHYKNSNPNWKNDYVGTIVVPIRIDTNNLYNKENGSFDLIGFLCVDSKSKNAFTVQQEAFNVGIMKSFADILYVLLSQYRHYFEKLKNNN